MCSLARPCAVNRNVSEACSSTQGPLGCGAWGRGGGRSRTQIRMPPRVWGPRVSHQSSLGRLGGLRAGATRPVKL